MYQDFAQLLKWFCALPWYMAARRVSTTTLDHLLPKKTCVLCLLLLLQMLKIGRPSKYQGPVTPSSTWQRLTGQEAADNVVDPATKVYRCRASRVASCVCVRFCFVFFVCVCMWLGSNTCLSVVSRRSCEVGACSCGHMGRCLLAKQWFSARATVAL